MKDKFFLLIGVLVISGSFYQVLRLPAPERFQKEFALKTGEKVIAVEVADTEEERAKGLSGRDALAEGRGILFIFPESGYHGFWMKEMKFAIDIVWIDESWRVIGIEGLVGPETFPLIFYPPGPVKYALEVNAGESQRLGIKPGDVMLEFRQ